jgi:hypothetical protein
VYTKQELEAVKKEPNIYLHIEFMPETKQFRVTIPRAGYRPVVDTLEEAMTVRDRMLASPYFPKAERYEPRKEFACYQDPNMEQR